MMAVYKVETTCMYNIFVPGSEPLIMPSKKHTSVAMLRSRRGHPVKELRSVRPLGRTPAFVARSKASMVPLRYMLTQRR